MGRFQKGVFVALIGLGLALPAAPPASASPVIDLNMAGYSTRFVEDGQQVLVAWTCVAKSNDPTTIATTITQCEISYNTTTLPAPVPVTVNGPVAATGFSALLQAQGVEEVLLCMEARITRLLASEITERDCTTIAVSDGT